MKRLEILDYLQIHLLLTKLSFIHSSLKHMKSYHLLCNYCTEQWHIRHQIDGKRGEVGKDPYVRHLICRLLTHLNLYAACKHHHTIRCMLCQSIDHFRDLPTDSQTTDITHFAVVFNYDVTIAALEILRSTAKCL